MICYLLEIIFKYLASHCFPINYGEEKILKLSVVSENPSIKSELLRAFRKSATREECYILLFLKQFIIYSFVILNLLQLLKGYYLYKYL